MLSNEITPDYIRGFADGEGGFHGHHIHISNTDWRLLERIRDQLAELDIECIIDRTGFLGWNPNWQLAYRVRITGTVNLVRFARLVGFSQMRKQKALEDYIRHRCRKGTQYNLENHRQYVELIAEGHSLNSIAKSLGIAYNALWKRVHNGTWPLPNEVIEILTPFQP